MSLKTTAAKSADVAMSLDLAGLFLEHAPAPMAIAVGERHVVSFVNPAFSALMEQPAEHIVGKPFCELLPDMHNCAAALARVYRGREPEKHTEQLHSKPNPVFWSYVVWPVIANGLVAGAVIQVTETADFREMAVAMNEALVLGSVRQHELTEAADASNAQLQQEISVRKQAEEALQRTQAQLSDHAGELEGLVTERTLELTSTNQQLEAFVYSIAHDLRAPLRAMQGFSELLVVEAGAALSDSGKGYADRINKSAQFMDALLCDLLAFSRISQQRVELSPVNLEVVVESVLARLQSSIQELGARVQSTGPWPGVLAHEPTLTQVLFNLTSNALKFSRPGVAPLLQLWCEEQAQLIRVWIADNGVGIATDYQAQVFRLFTRLNGEKYPGTGIGLAIVQKGVERMGGNVGVESTLHEGSRFWFELQKA